MAVFERQFGPAAPPQIAAWLRFAREQKPPALPVRAPAGGEVEVLRVVNDFFNRIRWLEDPQHWGRADYWATPAETVASGGGDCEDFAIAKYYLLKELGVPIERMRITYVMAKRENRAHMVLAYYATPDAEPLILDNIDRSIRPASQRADLDPVYSFNDDALELVQARRRAAPAQIRNWRSLQERLHAEAAT